MDLMVASVYKPDTKLRTEAKELECYEELMQIRDDVVNYLHQMREEMS